MKEEILRKLEASSDFIDFYCYKEDKWLQNANLNEKIIAVFGSIENAEMEFKKYKKDNLIEDKLQ
jgi:hypothetical protein